MSSSSRALRAPSADRFRVLWVMVVGIEPQPTTKPRLAGELVVRRALDEVDEPAMDLVHLSQYLGDRQPFLPLRHEGVEGVDAAIRGAVPRGRAALQGACRPPG